MARESLKRQPIGLLAPEGVEGPPGALSIRGGWAAIRRLGRWGGCPVRAPTPTGGRSSGAEMICSRRAEASWRESE